VRGRWIAPLAALAVIGFTILARPTPSMVRASLMALLALLVGVTGRRRSGVPLLCAATLALLLGSPSLSHEYGFALSVAATAGLFLLAPRWRERLAAWLPERVAESLACVAAAELCCLPIVAALAGSVSLLGVPANLLVDIAVGPATVLGALALVCGASLQPLGVLCAWLAQWPAAWIVLVARAGSRVPGARLPWPAGWRGALLLLLGYAVIACLTLRRAASHRHRGSRLYQGADAMNGHERSPVDQAGVDRITDGHAGGALRRPDAIAVISLVPTSLRGASRRAATIIPPKVLAARQPTPDHGLADAAARDEPTRTGRGSLVPTVPRTASKARSGHRLSATHGMLTPMPRNPQTQNSTGPSPLTIAVGPEELLAERAIADVIAAARAVAPDTQVAEIGAAAFTPGEFAQLVSPSLFGERTIVVLRAAQDLSGANVKVVVDYLAAPVDEVALVMTHAGGAKGKALLDAARKNGATVVDCAKITKPGDRIAFVRHEFRDAGRTVSEDAARALIDAVGSDLRELAAACSQLAADATGPIDEAFVARYYSGRAETSGFIVADRAVEGRAADALEQLRWALATGVAPVLITSALAQGVRSIARLGSAPRGMRPADLARELGMPPWKVDRVRSQLRGWTPDGIGRALRAVAEADAAVKGGGDDPAYALERAVLAITDARASRS
jgi:DNA polymerase-3 subunit delta